MAEAQHQLEHFKDGTCLLWVTLALARLNHMLPPDSQALDLFLNHNDAWALRLRNALDAVVRGFTDPNETEFWDALGPDHASVLVSELLRTALNYYQDLDEEFTFLRSNFKAFHNRIQAARVQHATDTFGALGMACTIAGQVSKLLKPRMSKVFITINTMRENLGQEEFEADLAVYARDEAVVLPTNIELFIREQTGLLSRSLGSTAIDVDIFVKVIQAALRTHILAALDVLLRSLGAFASNGILATSLRTRQNLQIFYRNIARFFSHASPLLSDFWPSENDHEEDAFEEYSLDDLEDVLIGPDSVDIDELSISVSHDPATDCAVCFDAYSTLPKLACAHEYCEECLNTQLGTHHACRYRCGSCRAEFFSGCTK
ncbi:hypothetical protein FB567DRAFT_522225 [Paraphoma chrysanthemicola]|uniref:RING-type domain-containing protein n=1 Tax=Paraphoma chrysanthemicola TaxID=798071 RepID=A0A8K0R7H1_9PLEO|nr:hypothetical protein FB567DRAFT_522225 [Paraphoma chrysanthemicola]